MSTSKENLLRNIKAFKAMEPELVEKYPGQYALLYDEELVQVFSDKESARIAAAQRYPEANLGAIGLYVAPAGA